MIPLRSVVLVPRFARPGRVTAVRVLEPSGVLYCVQHDTGVTWVSPEEVLVRTSSGHFEPAEGLQDKRSAEASSGVLTTEEIVCLDDLSLQQRANYLIARRLAEQSESCRRTRHGAVLAKKKIISVGANRPSQPGPAHYRELWLKYGAATLHAEADALAKAKGRVRGATLYVVRVNANDVEDYSRPCACCVASIERAGIKRVFYSLGAEMVGALKFRYPNPEGGSTYGEQ